MKKLQRLTEWENHLVMCDSLSMEFSRPEYWSESTFPSPGDLSNPGIEFSQLVKNLPTMQETWVWSLDWEDSPGEGKSYPLLYSGLENYMDSPWGCKESDITERLWLWQKKKIENKIQNIKIMVNGKLLGMWEKKTVIYLIFNNNRGFSTAFLTMDRTARQNFKKEMKP